MSRIQARRLRRWGVFNLVGVLGFGVQLTALFGLKRILGINYLAATAIAVEMSVIHNFVWHEHVTWADMGSALRHGALARLLRFHLANGLISIAGNIGLTWIFVELLRWPYLLANGASVIICSSLNFTASDRLVFGGGFLRQQDGADILS